MATATVSPSTVQAPRSTRSTTQRSTASSYIIVSPNEAQRLQTEEDRKRRLERLKQVREQERRIAAQRRDKFREQSGREWARVVQDLHEKWEDGKTARLIELENLLARLAKYIGQAQNDADLMNLEKAIEVETLRKALIQMQHKETIRNNAAAREHRIEFYDRIEPEILRNAILRSVRLQESLRSHLIANRYREIMKMCVPTTEIPSQPLARMNRLMMNKKPSDYEHTSVHRDHVVVRCHQPRRMDAEPAELVRAAAEIERRRREDQLLARETMLRNLEVVARERYNDAMRDINMAKKREQVIKQLDNLALDDRRRKQTNAGLYASKFRRDHIRLSQDDLKHRFMRQFDLAEGGEEAFRSPVKRNHPRRPSVHSVVSTPSIDIALAPLTPTLNPLRAKPQRRPALELGIASRLSQYTALSEAVRDVSADADGQ